MASLKTQARAAHIAGREAQRRLASYLDHPRAFLRALPPEAREAYASRTTRGVGSQRLAPWVGALHFKDQDGNRAARRAARAQRRGGAA